MAELTSGLTSVVFSPYSKMFIGGLSWQTSPGETVILFYGVCQYFVLFCRRDRGCSPRLGSAACRCRCRCRCRRCFRWRRNVRNVHRAGVRLYGICQPCVCVCLCPRACVLFVRARERTMLFLIRRPCEVLYSTPTRIAGVVSPS